jgi:Double zinc ribbon/Adenylate and Guanylate cyclase catalytic domain
MNCPSCQAALPEDAAFCGHCGGALRSERVCTRCGRSNSPAMRLCLGCGSPLSPAAPAQAPRTYTPHHLVEKILTSRSALEGERKQVTVLFADLKGSMDLAESIDPEDWHRIMERFFQILTDGVHRFEGTVNQYTGDGIMALFGAPIAHEDHAARACYAALALQDDLRRYANELRRVCRLPAVRRREGRWGSGGEEGRRPADRHRGSGYEVLAGPARGSRGVDSTRSDARSRRRP